LKQRIYIDVNSGVDRMSAREERIPYKIGSLLEEMKYYRIHSSLVYSSICRDYSFTKGNQSLIEKIGHNGRLFGLATVIPHIQYELDIGTGYYDYLLSKGIKAFKIYPKSLKHGSDPFTLEKLAEYMAGKDVPLFLDIEELDWEWKNVREILEAFPYLKVVLCNTPWSGNRNLFPLLDRFKNLYFEVSSNQANDILLTCKKHFGLDNVLFGTDYPHKVMGGLKALVEYSGLSELEKDKVSYRNAMEMLKLPEPEIYPDSGLQLDRIAQRIDQGLSLEDTLVIDAHSHLVDRQHYTVSNSPMLNGDEDNLIKKMNMLGVDKILISPWEGISTDGSAANETSLLAKEKYPGRIEAYAMCNPNYPEDLNAIIDIYHNKCRFIGLKPYYPSHRYDLLGEKYAKWFEYGDRNKLIMLVHTGTQHAADMVDKLSAKYRDMAFLMAHTGESYEAARFNLDVAARRENVYLEITYTALTNGVIEYLVEKIGADRVIFGTDMPMRDPSPQLAWVCYARISIEDKEKILGGNILKLLGRCYS
jgi:Predicted metal-dependent hydrolase of the TIM-barrel fold